MQNKSKKWITAIIIIIVLGLVGTAGYLIVPKIIENNSSENNSSENNSSENNSSVCHLPEFDGYNCTINSVQTLQFDQVSMEVPFQMTAGTSSSGYHTYESNEMTISQLSTYNRDEERMDFSLISGKDAYVEFMKKYTDQDPYSSYAIDYVVYAIDEKKELKKDDEIPIYIVHSLVSRLVITAI